jgi:restriction endonuclease S subunit
MKTTIANKSWFHDSDLRLDASFHLNETNQIKHHFKHSPYNFTALSNQSSELFSGNIFKRTYVKDENRGLPYLTGSDIIKADIDSGKFISRKQAHSLQRLILNEGWILVSCSGTLGNVVYTNKLFEGRIATHDLIRIVPNNKDVKPGFLYAYLASRYGYALLTQSSYGGVVKHIEPHHIKNLPVPIFQPDKQQQIHDLITQSAELRVEANKHLMGTVNYFNERYSIKADRVGKIFTKNINKLSFSWAAYNNNLVCDQILKKLGNDFFYLGDRASSIFAPPLFKHIYLKRNNGHPFLTGSELTQFNPSYYRFLSPKGVRDINDYKVYKGTLLLYKSGTTDGGILGNVFIVDDILSSACLSDHVIRITISDLHLSYWVFAFLKSNPGIKLLQSLATGSMIPFITPERLKKIPIPKQNEHFDKIVEAIDRYLITHSESKRKETQAIQLVEKEIDQWHS